MAYVDLYEKALTNHDKYISKNGLVMTRKNKAIKIDGEKIAVNALNHLSKLICRPVIKINKKNFVGIANSLGKVTKYEKIKKQIDRNKAIYKNDDMKIGSKEINKNDFFEYNINSYYRKLLLLAGYIKREEVYKLPFLELIDICNTLEEKKYIDRKLMLNDMMICNANTKGDSFKKTNKNIDREIRNIRDLSYDKEGFYQKQRELRRLKDKSNA